MASAVSPDAVKAAAPALSGALARPHLVARMAQVATPAKWVAAPSGTGKSTLVASYSASTGRTLVWYRLDPRDDDPAFFYARFASALVAALGALTSLPHYTPDDSGRELHLADRPTTISSSSSR
ncbi:MAG: hypothetical protein H0W18_17655 [Acidobacteria bacterium]|nr:hypothetical protein [Acidobacteriota bacterium]